MPFAQLSQKQEGQLIPFHAAPLGILLQESQRDGASIASYLE
jgi:hypothetical protein